MGILPLGAEGCLIYMSQKAASFTGFYLIAGNSPEFPNRSRTILFFILKKIK